MAEGTWPGQPPAALIAAVCRMLHPLVRYLVSVGISYPVFAEMLKRVFLDAARAEAQAAGGRLTDSRLMLLSGVHRKDIRRLSRETPEDAGVPALHNLGTTLVARWLSDPAYADEQGQPAPLARSAARGGALSFPALAQSVSADVRPRAILDELVRLGVVRIEGEFVRLDVGGFVPARAPDAKAFYFGEALHDHVAAGTHNLRGAAPPFLERSVQYDELAPAAVARIAERAQGLAMGMLTDLNRQAEAEERDDPPAPGQRMRMRVGVYFYSEPVHAPPALRLVAGRATP
ncbi:MAG: DUF6502 family protein [Betaproteobacteria bacterium]|nr:DUF6502 family protein [Betaproteobacteria bacterium]